MNILVDLLPTIIEIDKEKYEINSDFRTSIIFELMMQDNELNDKQKISNALELYYPVVPDNIEIAIDKLLWFYRCGKDVNVSNSNGNSANTRVSQIYNYDYDDDYIYSAFLDQYNVDLQDIEDLHWWKFKAMFKALKEDNMIVKIMKYRNVDLSKIKDKDERMHYKEMKELYKIPGKVDKNELEKINQIANALINNGDVSKIL